MKKKILAISLAIAMLAVALVGASLAFFTDTEEVTNTFTVGKVDITLTEPNWTDKSVIKPSAVIPKDPTVTIADDSEDCYVRLLITVNNKADLDKIFAAHKDEFSITDIIKGEKITAEDGTVSYAELSTNWDVLTATKTDVTADTRTYELRYKISVKANDVLDKPFENIVIPGVLDNDEIASINDLKIIVKAEAIQTSTEFADYNAALDELNDIAVKANA